MKTKLCISCLLIMLLCLGCGEDTPLESGPSEKTTPELFPLAEGASWKYSVYYFSRLSLGSCSIDKEYGRLELEVLQESGVAGAKEYRIGLRFMLDSLYFMYLPDCQIMDTTYTRYNVLDTTFYRTIVFANDTLWYESGDSLTIMMPDSIIAGSLLNLELFNVAGRYSGAFFYWSPSYISNSSDQYAFGTGWSSIPWGVELLSATLRPADGGIVQVDWYAKTGDISGYERRLQYTLTSYTPGAP